MDLEAILAASDSDSGGENDFSEQFTLEDILREHDDVEVRVEMPKSSSSSSAAAGRRASPAPDSAALRASPSPSSAAAADRDASSLDFALGLGLDDSSSDDDARPVSPLSEDDDAELLRKLLDEQYDSDDGENMDIDAIIHADEHGTSDDGEGSALHAADEGTSALGVDQLALAAMLESELLLLVGNGSGSGIGGRASAVETMSPLQLKQQQLAAGSGVGLVRTQRLEQVSAKLAAASKQSAGSRSASFGQPTALAVHPRYIIVATSRGLLLVFDHFQVLRSVIGQKEARKAGADAAVDPATAVDVSKTQDLALCGYESGKVALWDVAKGDLLKTVLGRPTGVHLAPVVHVRFRSDGTSAVTIDELGTVNVMVFNQRMGAWWGVRHTTVLAAGKQVFSLAVIASTPSEAARSVADVCPALIALSTEDNTFVVSHDERAGTKPLFRWPPPSQGDHASDNSPLPCLAWTWYQGYPVLARGWGSIIQRVVGQEPEPGQTALRFLVTGSAIITEHPVHALRWLDGTRIVYLTMPPTGAQFCVIDAVRRQLIERVAVGDITIVARPVARLRMQVDPAAAAAAGAAAARRPVARRCVENSFRGGDGSLYLVGVRCLLKARTQSWEEQKNALVEAGLWLDALALALNYFEQTASAVGQSPHVVEEVREEVGLILVQYASLNFAYGSSTSPGRFKLLGDICIYFCTVIAKPDILFGDLFQRFKGAGQEALFLDLLEPFILAGKLTFLDAEVLAAFVAHCVRSEGGATRAERCVLCMDPAAVADHLHSLTGVCKRWGMYSALAYHYTRGIGDYFSPLNAMMGAVSRCYDAAQEGEAAEAVLSPTTKSEEAHCDPRALAMKACLYLDYSFRGFEFPSKRELPPVDAKAAASQLAQGLLGMLNASAESRAAKQIRTFLLIAGPVVLRVVAQLLRSSATFSPDEEHSLSESTAAPITPSGCCPSRQRLLSAIVRVVTTSGAGELLQDTVLMLAAEQYVSGTYVDVELARSTMLGLIAVGTGEVPLGFGLDPTRSSSNSREKLIAAMLTVNGDSTSHVVEWDPAELLPLAEAAGFDEVTIILRRKEGTLSEIIAAYLVADSFDLRLQALAYLQSEAVRVGAMGASSSPGVAMSEEVSELRTIVLERLPELLQLDKQLTSRIVRGIFPPDDPALVLKLGKFPRLEFDYLTSLLDAQAEDDGPPTVLNAGVSSRFIELLCRFEPEKVYSHLISHADYPLMNALNTCRRHAITNATAYLLERTGAPETALEMMLSEVSARFAALESKATAAVSSASSGSSYPAAPTKTARLDASGTVAAPTASYATAGDASAVVTWDFVAADGAAAPIAGFIVRSQPPSRGAIIADRAASSATIEGLTNGQRYLFSVSAYAENAEEGEPVESVSVTAPATRSVGTREAAWEAIRQTIDLCQRYSISRRGLANDGASELMWFALTDVCISTQKRVKSLCSGEKAKGGGGKSSATLVALVEVKRLLTAFIRTILEQMRGASSLPISFRNYVPC